MDNNVFGLSYADIDTVQTINPEVAAHNIASAYIHSAYRKTNFPTDENVEFESVAKIAETYVYAYNYTVHQNNLIDDAE